MITVHRAAAELTVAVVNASRDASLDADWTAALVARESLPVRHGPRSTDSDAASVHRVLVRLAEDVGPVFTAPDATTAAARLNGLLASVDVQVSVSISDAWPPHLHFDAYGNELGDRLRVNCLTAIAALLADSASAMRIGECASPACEYVYVDFSRSARQRFCSRRCATRSHVSDHRRRRAVVVDR